jgi:hypothetical protein
MDQISQLKNEAVQIDRFDISVNRNLKTIEIITIKKIILFITHLFNFIKLMIARKYDLILIPQSFNLSAFIKDSVFIIISKFFNAKV